LGARRARRPSHSLLLGRHRDRCAACAPQKRLVPAGDEAGRGGKKQGVRMALRARPARTSRRRWQQSAATATQRERPRIRLDADARPATQLELVNCVLRGEATGLLVRQATPVRLEWTNGLLVTSERLIHLGGDGERPATGELLDVRLGHVTAVADQGLVELVNSASRPFLLPASIDCQHCVLLTQRWHPLIRQAGPATADAFRNQLRYRGRENDYAGMETFWELRPRDMTDGDSLDFDAWRARWNEVQSRWQQVQWRFPADRNRPLHGHRASDYELASPGADLRSTTDGAASGLVASDLPRLPAPPSDLPRRTRPRFQF